ncbi:hypothetical protein QT327_10505 [Olivibacter sp. 47]|uniref:DUF6706 family protein n=1 Tax=Olivibacter sp. 47 TaxID=3056486 RepID=UPI0025A3E73B|nr:DUF6706 family protein [Olivibacter sp. 47]MDM8174782.1 hypothetical protein [Olivibacter sp. 47]
MTNREALKSKIAQPVPEDTIDLNLIEQNLQPDSEYDPSSDINRKGIDLALAGLILFVCFQPKSVRELDYQITQQDVSDLLRLRSGLLARWNEEDDMDGVAIINSISDRW